MTGVEIMAHIVETEIRGGGLAEFNPVASILLDLVSGLALIWLRARSVQPSRFPAPTSVEFGQSASSIHACPIDCEPKPIDAADRPVLGQRVPRCEEKRFATRR